MTLLLEKADGVPCTPRSSFCAANEMFFIALYLLAFYTDESTMEHRVLHGIAMGTFPIMAVKTVISLVHLHQAAYNIAAVDADIRSAKTSADSKSK
jgi:CDP-diacylglycerol--inositol 3-phosphatidyltransferase|eukprot:m.197340 g.197340  ORF g.197340 m.197340 type:complete len:96 (+) comp25086_c0_seq4:170-457(+)